MENLERLFLGIGVASSVISVAALFLKPLYEVKVYAAFAGVIAAIALCLLPVVTNEKSAFGKVDCGSILVPKTISGHGNASNSELDYIVPMTLNGVCKSERNERLYFTLFVGMISLAALINAVREARAIKFPKSG